MKTTLDLPEDLAAKLKDRAALDGRQLSDVALRLLTTALQSPNGAADAATLVPKHLPVIKGRPVEAAHPRSEDAQDMCDFVKNVEQQDERLP